MKNLAFLKTYDKCCLSFIHCYLMHKYNLILHGKKNKLKILHLITYYKYCTGKRKKEAIIHVYKLCCEHRRLLCFKNTVDRGLTLQDKKIQRPCPRKKGCESNESIANCMKIREDIYRFPGFAYSGFIANAS